MNIGVTMDEVRAATITLGGRNCGKTHRMKMLGLSVLGKQLVQLAADRERQEKIKELNIISETSPDPRPASNRGMIYITPRK